MLKLLQKFDLWLLIDIFQPWSQWLHKKTNKNNFAQARLISAATLSILAGFEIFWQGKIILGLTTIWISYRIFFISYEIERYYKTLPEDHISWIASSLQRWKHRVYLMTALLLILIIETLLMIYTDFSFPDLSITLVCIIFPWYLIHCCPLKNRNEVLIINARSMQRSTFLFTVFSDYKLC